VSICLLSSCTHPKYLVRLDKDLQNADWTTNPLNYIPLMESDLASSQILSTTYSLLTQQKYSQLNKYLSSCKEETPDYLLAKTLYYISKCDYEKGMVYCEKMNGNYPLLEQLIIIDLRYELAKIKGEINYKNFLQDYQVLIDSYPDNELLKKIIAIRLRYIRYVY
jgi:hypothetical protein